jgi:DNA-binding response OmpR family regulator
MDGFHMLRELRKSVEVDKTTIVAVTGLDEEDIALRGGLPAGVQIMRKPVPFDRLLGIAQDLHEAANPAQMHSVDASHNWTN